MTSKTAHRPTASAPLIIAIGLDWRTAILLVFAAVLVVRAMGMTTTPAALMSAAFIAVAFGLPAIVLFLLGYCLDSRADKIESIRHNDDFR